MPISIPTLKICVLCVPYLCSPASVSECELLVTWSTSKVSAQLHMGIHGWVTDNGSSLPLCCERYSEPDTISDYDSQLIREPVEGDYESIST